MFSKADIEKYFIGEKQESLWFLVIGAAAIVLALVFIIFFKPGFYKGLAIPLAIVGIIWGIVGYTVYKRSDNDRVNNVYAYDLNPAQLKNKELPRMEKVMKNFMILRFVELFLLALGIGLYFYFIRDIRHDFWRGFGMSLAVVAMVSLFADGFAESRGRMYMNGLREFLGANRSI